MNDELDRTFDTQKKANDAELRVAVAQWRRELEAQPDPEGGLSDAWIALLELEGLLQKQAG